MLPPQSPRYYSLSTSPLARGSRKGKILVSVCENVLHRKGRSAPVRRRGLCSGYLEDLSHVAKEKGKLITLECFLRPSNDFHLPKDPRTPMMLVGFGTGVAPFLGFLEHR
ncbi:hypothetical protein GUITHDRAFT_71954, partial [Guillardia theta CCMP2712]